MVGEEYTASLRFLYAHPSVPKTPQTAVDRHKSPKALLFHVQRKAMFRQASSPSSYSDAFMHHHHAASFSAALSVTVPAQIPRAAAAAGFLDGGNVGAFSSPPSSCYSSSSSSSSLPSSYFNYNNSLQRSISSHSLPMHLQLPDVPLGGAGGGGFYSPSSPASTHQLTTLPPLSSSPSSSSGELFEFTSSCPVRRVFSTGDLQGMNGSPPPVASGDGCGQDQGGGPFSQKVGRYSAEERKERIERYRVKRHQRNFNKKITYACRKTLADSRPRVKGRFARNGEADGDADEREASDTSYEYGCGHSELISISNGNGNGNGNAYSAAGSCYDDGHHYHYSSKVNGGAGAGAGNSSAIVSAFSAGENGEWWWRVPGAAAGDDEAQRQRQVGFDEDEELWATLGDMAVSVNLAS